MTPARVPMSVPLLARTRSRGPFPNGTWRQSCRIVNDQVFGHRCGGPGTMDESRNVTRRPPAGRRGRRRGGVGHRPHPGFPVEGARAAGGGGAVHRLLEGEGTPVRSCTAADRLPCGRADRAGSSCASMRPCRTGRSRRSAGAAGVVGGVAAHTTGGGATGRLGPPFRTLRNWPEFTGVHRRGRPVAPPRRLRSRSARDAGPPARPPSGRAAPLLRWSGCRVGQ